MTNDNLNNLASKPKAVVLLSGGLDSATTLAHAVNEGFRCWALSFDYGQRNRRELNCAGRQASLIGAVKHHIVKLDPALFASSALTGAEPVPRDRDIQQLAKTIPPTYVPARNTVFLSMALALAEQIGAFDIFIGANAVDYSGYPDCREEYLQAFEAMANLATRAAVQGKGRFKIHAPLMHLTKCQIICRATALGVNLSLTNSCYDPDQAGRACGRCDSCILRREGFVQAGLEDPLEYHI